MSSDFFGTPPDDPSKPSRRRFVQGPAATGAVAGLGLWPEPGWAVKSPGHPVVLSGTEFDPNTTSSGCLLPVAQSVIIGDFHAAFCR